MIDIQASYSDPNMDLRSLKFEFFFVITGNSVLHIASQNGRTGIIDELILRGADVNHGNNHKNTALHLGK